MTKRGHAHADHVGCSQVIAYPWAARACGPSMSPLTPILSFVSSTMLEGTALWARTGAHRLFLASYLRAPTPIRFTSSLLNGEMTDLIRDLMRVYLTIRFPRRACLYWILSLGIFGFEEEFCGWGLGVCALDRFGDC